MWGIVPAAGMGSRIQPLAFSKELLPVGSRLDGDTERPRAVSEYLVERMILAGARKICFVISPGKADILAYYGAGVGPARISYVVQPQPAGLCDAVFRALPLIHPEEPVLVGLPDTIWFPEDGLCRLEKDRLSFLLFPVDRPELFDAVVTDEEGSVLEIRVKQPQAGTRWVWGAFAMPGTVLRALHELWSRPERRDEYIGTLVNAWLKEGGRATAVRAGQAYVDLGTLHGYREALRLLNDRAPVGAAPGPLGAAIGPAAGVRSARAPDRPSGAAGRPAGAGAAGEAAIESAAGGGTGADDSAVGAAAGAGPAGGPSASGGPAGPRLLTWTREQIEHRVRELGGWFHNLDLQGVRTAPDHFLGDYPSLNWKRFAHAVPPDLRGRTVLDIGCNGGFYSIEMKKRGADRVVAIDSDEDYLAQARFAAEVSGFPDIEFHRLSVYDLGGLGERFDLVLFLGVLYHLRHPLLALDLIHEHASRDLLVFQSMQRGSPEVEVLEEDYSFVQTGIFDRPGYPRLHFVERRYSGDVTNWWIPNRACVEAMLRSAGFQVLDRPEEEVYICRHVEPVEDIAGPRAVYPRRGGRQDGPGADGPPDGGSAEARHG